jgi:hypothetical protein
LDAWLLPAAKVVGYDTDTSDILRKRLRDEKSLWARTIMRSDEAVGIVVFKLNTPKRGSACFELVATPPSQARKGAGMAAAALVERQMFDAGIQAVYAPAPEKHGISMYFWIRLGYAPLLKTEWPCEREGVAWLGRSLTGRGTR